MTISVDQINQIRGPRSGIKTFLLMVVMFFYLGSSYAMAQGRQPRPMMSIERFSCCKCYIPGIAHPPSHRAPKRHLPLTQRFQDWFVLSLVGHNHPDLAERSDPHSSPIGLHVQLSATALDAGRAPPSISCLSPLAR